MFNPQQTSQAAARRPPILGMQQQPPPQSQNDISAKEKLACYVYEYLVHSGAAKTAEGFKSEVLMNTQIGKTYTPSETGPGFLQNWWLVFWDLYCASPERRDEGTSTLEAKQFYELGLMPHFVTHGPGGPMMNGMHGPQFGGPSMGMPPGAEAMMPGHPGGAGFPGRYGGRGGPTPMPPAGFGMFPGGDPRMAQRLPPAGMRIPAGFPGMRPVPCPPGQPGMPYGRPQPFMDSPGGSFPPGGMMQNGGVMCPQTSMSMSSPGPGGPIPSGPPGGDPLTSDPNRFMMMPTSSSAMPPFSMTGDPVQQPTSLSNGNGENMNMQVNGEEMKQSPASTPRAVNGTGTPGGAGPGSQAPGSVQSQGAAGVTNDSEQQQQNAQAFGGEEASDIMKIKQGLLDEFKSESMDGQQYPF